MAGAAAGIPGRDPTEIGDKILAEGTHKERSLAMECVKEYGTTSIRLVFALNGAAIIALLTLIGSLHSKDSNIVSGYARELTTSLLPAFFLYGIGVFSAAFTAGIGYLNWSFVAESYWQPADLYKFFRGETIDPPRRWVTVFIETTRVLAVLLFFVGLIAFGWASWLTLEAFGTARAG
jgi:hypothetical protein